MYYGEREREREEEPAINRRIWGMKTTVSWPFVTDSATRRGRLETRSPPCLRDRTRVYPLQLAGFFLGLRRKAS